MIRCLWEKLPQVERDRLINEALKAMEAWKSRRTKGWATVAVPFKRWSEADNTVLLTLLRNWGFAGIHSFHPGYPDAIAGASLSVRVIPVTDLVFPYRVELRTFLPEGEYTLVWGADTSFLWKQ